MINTGLNSVQRVHEESLKAHNIREQILKWMDENKLSRQQAARTLKVNRVALSSYLEGKDGFSVQLVENAFHLFSNRQEEGRIGRHEYVASPFVMTGPSRELWQILHYAKEERCIAVGSACSGIGKTATVDAFVYSEPDTILITADLTLRRSTNLLRVLANRLEVAWRYGSYTSSSTVLGVIIDRLKRYGELIIIDDAHFLKWESVELLRKIHDLAGIGIGLIGQPKLYDEMRGPKGYLFDQIFSRIGIRRDLSKIERDDVRMICEGMSPDGLDKRSIDFLFKKAQGQGRFRPMVNILKLALKQHAQSGDPVDLDLLMAAAEFLKI